MRFLPGGNWARWLPWALVALSAALRLVNLSHAPEFVNDEGFNIETARGLMVHDQMVRWFLQVPFLDLNKPFLYPWLLGKVFGAFGLGAWQARLLSALAGILTTHLLYLLGKRLWDWRAGMLAGLLHATAHPMLWADRVAKEDALGAALSLLALLLALRSVQDEKPRDMGLAGLVMGLALLVKASVAFVPVGILVGLLVLMARREVPTRAGGAMMVLLALGLAVPLAPWLGYYHHFSQLAPYAQGLVPFAPLMLPEFLSLPMGAILRPAELLSPGALSARTTRVLTQLLVWDPVRALGFAGVLSLLLSRQTLRHRGGLMILAQVLVGLAAFWVLGGRLRYVHSLLLVLYLLAGWLLWLLWQATRQSPVHRLAPVLVVMLVLLGLTHAPGRLDTPNYDLYPDTWRPLVTTDCGQLVRAAHWLRENAPATARLYCDASVGALSNHEYVDMVYFPHAVAIYRRYRPEYLAVTYRLRYCLAEGEGLDPFATFDLQPVKQITGEWAEADVQIYRIRGLKSPRTLVRVKGELEPR